eukprot:SAG25_NODE_160_length_13390_cov_9.002708_16_plen_331_part_00
MPASIYGVTGGDGGGAAPGWVEGLQPGGGVGLSYGAAVQTQRRARLIKGLGAASLVVVVGTVWYLASAGDGGSAQGTPAPAPSPVCRRPMPPTPPGVPSRVLFSGNSFTYGPPARLPGQTLPDEGPLNNLPRLFTLVAHSLGVPVITGEDTIGGCTAYAHRDSACAPSSGGGAAPGCESVMRKATYATARGFPRSVWDAKGPDWQPYRVGGTCALHKSCNYAGTGSFHTCSSQAVCNLTQSGADGHAGGGFPRCNETMPAGLPAHSPVGPMVPFLPASLAAQCALPCATSAGGGGGAACAQSLSSSRGTYHPCPQLARGPALEPPDPAAR